jgi:hypothetical protein
MNTDSRFLRKAQQPGDRAVAFAGASPFAPLVARVAWILLTIGVAVFLAWMQFAMTAPYRLTTFEQLIHFNAVEPFQHRVLVPALVIAIQAVAPLRTVLTFGLVEAAFWIALLHLAGKALAQFKIADGPLDRRLWALTLVVPMVLQLIIPNLGLQFGVDNGAVGLAQINAYRLFYYVYDLPAAVFTLALFLVLVRLADRPHNRPLWAGYVLLFALATLNRETTVFVLPYAGVVFWRLADRRLMPALALLGANILLFIAIQAPLQWFFSSNVNPSPDASMSDLGIPYEGHLVENLSLLFLHPMFLLMFLVRFCGGAYLPVLLSWRYLDRHLARVLIFCALPLFVVAMAAGRIVEHRIFIEIVPLVWLAAVQITTTRRRMAEHSPGQPAPGPDDL